MPESHNGLSQSVSTGGPATFRQLLHNFEQELKASGFDQQLDQQQQREIFRNRDNFEGYEQDEDSRIWGKGSEGGGSADHYPLSQLPQMMHYSPSSSSIPTTGRTTMALS
jgi:hypothetical protein